MEYRSLSVVALLTALAGAVNADTPPDPARVADWEQRLAKATDLQRRAEELRADAESRLAAQELVCAEKFLVNDCRIAARKAYIADIESSRRLKNDGLAIERTVRHEQRVDKDARQLADAPAKAAERAQRAADVAAERDAAAARRAETLSEKARQAEEGAQRRAAHDERIRRKQAEHAEKMARREAELARKANKANKTEQ